MKRIYNITKLRAEISSIVSEVQTTGIEALIIRDSQPAAVLIPYKKFLEYTSTKQKKTTNVQSIKKYASTLQNKSQKKNIDVNNIRDHIDYGGW